MKRGLLLSAITSIVVLFCGTSVMAQQAPPVASKEYNAGQVWKYRTAPGAEESWIVILKVESRRRKGDLVHIRIENMPLASCNGMHFTTAIEHLAVPEKDLRKSTTELLKEGVELPDSYFEAYKQWQSGTKQRTTRPLAQVALPEPIGPMICNWREAT